MTIWKLCLVHGKIYHHGVNGTYFWRSIAARGNEDNWMPTKLHLFNWADHDDEDDGDDAEDAEGKVSRTYFWRSIAARGNEDNWMPTKLHLFNWADHVGE
uniref:Uncharacterized protein n=1 Tax=Oryza rufipogon TaxID=4529 RepID=A0A0E0N308_ORYRU